MSTKGNAAKVPPLDPNILRVWRSLNDFVMTASEDDLWKLLAMEKQGKARRLFLQRIYGRAATLRGKREAQELISSAKDFNV